MTDKVSSVTNPNIIRSGITGQDYFKVITTDTGDEMKKDYGKLPWHLLPSDAVEEVVKVLDFGAKKYSARGWETGMAWSRPFSAAMRHLWKWFRGEGVDSETGLSHLAHAACNILFLLAYEKRNMTHHDDRGVGNNI